MSTNTQTGMYVVLTNVGSEAAAREIAETLVEERLAACVNVVPGLRSVYRWKGEIVRDEEVLLLVKTTAHRYAQAEERLRELHPYEVPEVLALEAATGHAAYLDWVGESVEPDQAPEA